MAKLLFVIFVSFVVSTSVLSGESVCSHYDDKGCVHPNTIKNGYYTNQWSVYLPGISKKEAKQLLEDNGFDYLGQIMSDLELYLVTRKSTLEKHAMPDKKAIESLMKIKQVHSVVQKHVLENSADHMFSIVDGTKIECQPLDPTTIKLNDGSENLKRAQELTGVEATDTMYTVARPTSNSGSINPLAGHSQNKHGLDGGAATAVTGEKPDAKDKDVEAAIMAAAAVATATAVAQSLSPMMAMANQWTMAGNGGPYFGDVLGA